MKVSLEEISQVTRIRRTILEAMENDRYDLMPPKVFAQGFIKSYASYLGLDESDAVKRYCDVVEEPEKNEIEAEQGTGTSPVRYFLVALLVLGAGLLAGAALLFFMSPQGTQQEADVAQPRPQDLLTTSVVAGIPLPRENTVEAPVETTTVFDQEAVETASTVSVETTSIAAEPAGQQDIPAAGGPLVLRIVASEESWMKIRCDNNEPGEVYLRRGETHTVEAQEKFFVRIGNAGGVELFLNEQALGRPGKPGEVIELTLPE